MLQCMNEESLAQLDETMGCLSDTDDPGSESSDTSDSENA